MQKSSKKEKGKTKRMEWSEGVKEKEGKRTEDKKANCKRKKTQDKR